MRVLPAFHHDPVWNTKELVARLSETYVSSCVLLHLRTLIVDTAIEFNNQPKFMAIEINDENLFGQTISAPHPPSSVQLPARTDLFAARVHPHPPLRGTLSRRARDLFQNKPSPRNVQTPGGPLKGSWACAAGHDCRIVFSFVQHERKEAILLETIGTLTKCTERSPSKWCRSRVNLSCGPNQTGGWLLCPRSGAFLKR